MMTNNQSTHFEALTLGQLAQLIREGQYPHLFITGHVHADGDCIGACLGMHRLLKQMGIHSRVVLSDCPSTYHYLIREGEIETHYEAGGAIGAMVIVMDNGDPHRTNVGDRILEDATTVVNIDHHISNTLYGDYVYVTERS